MNVSKPENVCPICNKVFSRKADCNRHRRLHDDIRPHTCVVLGCGKRFAQYTALKTHLNVHTGEKPFRCGSPGCQATFGDPSSCARHRREIHNPRKPFKCLLPGCSSSILRLSSFRVHLKKHGLNPDDYMESFKRSQSPVEVSRSIEPRRITGGQDSSLYASSFNQEAPLSDPANSWDSLFSSVDPSMPLVMPPEYNPELSCGSPLLRASSSQFPLDYNPGYFLSPSSLGASSAASSRYSSPVASTQVMTPEMESGFVGDVSVQPRCSVPQQQDWTGNGYWQAYGIQFVG